MYMDEMTIIRRVVANYAQTGQGSDGQVQVTCLPEGKTSIVETIDTDGRSVMLDEYLVDGQSIWAGFSNRSGTVFLSPGRKR
jgi:hypothetical protein